MSELSRLLQDANDRNPMTVRERAKRIGNALHYAAIADLQAGRHGQPREKTLRLLAVAYDIPYPDVQRAAGVKVGAGPYEPPAEAARLSAQERDAITHLIKVMVSTKDVDSGPDQTDSGSK